LLNRTIDIAGDFEPTSRDAAAYHAYALGALGSDLAETGDLGAGKRYLLEALKRKKKLGEPRSEAIGHLQLGLVELQMGNHEAARTHADRSVALFRRAGPPSETASALTLRARASAAMDDIAGAEADLRDAVAMVSAKREPLSYGTALGDLASLLELRGDAVAAARAYEEAAAALERARSDSVASAAYLRLAALRFRSDETVQAHSASRRAIDLARRGSGARNVLAEAWALHAATSAAPTEAIAGYEAALSATDDRALGDRLILLSQLDDSLKSRRAEVAVSLGELSTQLLGNLDTLGRSSRHVLLATLVNLRRGAETKRVLRTFERELEDLEALDARVLRSAGRKLEENGDYEAARAAYGVAAETFRRLGQELELAAALQDLGDVAHSLGTLKRAERLYTESLALRPPADPDRAHALLMLGRTLEREKRFEEALTSYLEAATAAEASNLRYRGVALHDAGDAAHALGRLDESARYYRESVQEKRRSETDVDTAWTLYQLGIVEAERGEKKAALAALRSAMTLAKTSDRGNLRTDIRSSIAALEGGRSVSTA
jgi:tetratricopeptide (TPR) repeat protein